MTGTVNPTKGFSYDPPTQNTDGSPLKLTDIAKFQLGFGQTPGNYTLIKDDVQLEVGKQSSPISLATGLAYGQWYVAARTVSKDGVNSAWSAELPFELRPPVPEPPVNFSLA